MSFASAVVAAMATLLLPAIAGAGANDGRAVNPAVRAGAANTIELGVQTSSGGGGGTVGRSSSPLDECRWVVVPAADSAVIVASMTGIPAGIGAPGMAADVAPEWVVVLCPMAVDPSGVYTFYPYNAAPPQVAIDMLVASAYDRLALPALTMQGAPAGDRAAPAIVQLPTWLWVDPAEWRPVSEDAAVPGARVVATATPVHTVWDPGSGEAAVTCGGPGRPYDFGRSETSQSTDCSHTYRHSSALASDGDAFLLELTVRWEVDWVCEPGCGAGVLPPFEITSSRPVRVAEVQALNTRNT